MFAFLFFVAFLLLVLFCLFCFFVCVFSNKAKTTKKQPQSSPQGCDMCCAVIGYYFQIRIRLMSAGPPSAIRLSSRRSAIPPPRRPAGTHSTMRFSFRRPAGLQVGMSAYDSAVQFPHVRNPAVPLPHSSAGPQARRPTGPQVRNCWRMCLLRFCM